MKHILLFAIFVFTALVSRSQSALNGRISSGLTGDPMPAVIIKNKNNKTTTDQNGFFKISVSVGDTLHLAKEGYTSLAYIITPENSSTPIRLTLQPLATNMQEVVVNNGYQPLPKERATGAYSHIDSKTLSQQVSTDVLSRLESVASGLNFDRKRGNGKTSIMIRGLSTIQGPKDPLVVVDNFPYSGDIDNINPNDVESITALKDAAATSVWGARAGNGVIVITTKKARFNKKPTVTVSSNIMFTDAPNLDYLRLMNASEFIEVEKFLFKNGFRFSDTAAVNKPAFSQVYEILFKQRRGLISEATTNARLDSLGRQDLREEYKSNVYRQAINSQTAVSVQGGSSNAAWRLSAGYDHNVGSLRNDYQRRNVNVNHELKPSKNLSISTALWYTNTSSTAAMSEFGTIQTAIGFLPMYTRFKNDSGVYTSLPNNYRQSYIDTAGGGKLLSWNYNPLQDYENTRSKTEQQSIVGNISIGYRFLKMFNASIRYQYEKQTQESSSLASEQTYAARSVVNSFSQLNRQTGVIKYIVPKGGILDQSFSNLEANNLRTQLEFNKNFKDHAFVALAGWELRRAKSTDSRNRTYGYNDDVLTFSNVDYINQYPTFVTGSLAFIQNNNGFDRSTSNFISTFGNAGYSYLNRYHLTASARRDASNLFGAAANDKWNMLWSVGTALDISKEPFYKLDWMPYLRLRATYGKSGNIDPSMAAVTTIAYFTTSPYTNMANAIFDKYKNPNLSWEEIATTNLALDFKMFNSRLAGNIDLYFKKGKNLYGTTPVDYTSVPTPSLVKNVASIKGSGLDLELNSININRKLQWTSQLHFSINQDKVTKYYLENRQGSLFTNGGNSISAIEGRPVYAVYTYKWAGLNHDTGDPMGYLNGAPSNNYTALTGSTVTIDSLIYHGRALPKVFGSLGNGLRFKGFYLNARITYKFGYYFVKNTINYTSLFNSNLTHSDFAKRWQKPGDEASTDVPSMTYPSVTRRDNFYRATPVHVSKGDHIRFQYLSFGYEFTEENIKNLPFKTLTLFAGINNLGILWRANEHKLDPDYLSTAIPPSTSFALSFNIHFK